jgi:hypothetical protein
MKRPLPYWIKERHNPQLGIYYVACGRLSKADAMKAERALYGDNIMRRFDTLEAYQARLDELRKAGERVQ